MKYGIKVLTAVVLSVVTIAVQATCVPAIPSTTPNSDFKVNNDGTATQKKTGLMWKVCSQGQTWLAGSCSGTASAYTWQGALQIPQALNPGGGFAGYTDWRLPNIKELASIAELACTDPAINVAVFPSTPSDFYWSASPYAGHSDVAWGVYFDGGYDYNYYGRGSTYRVRLVRGAISTNPRSIDEGQASTLSWSAFMKKTPAAQTQNATNAIPQSVLDSLTAHSTTTTKIPQSVLDSLTAAKNNVATTIPQSVLDSLSAPRVSLLTNKASYQTTLTATGGNFRNLTQIRFDWSGPTVGTKTWYKSDKDWDTKVVVSPDGSSMTLAPVVTLAGDPPGLTTWTVTLTDTSGSTATKMFTVNYTVP